MNSSHIRDRCIIATEHAYVRSSRKSRSLTASMLFLLTSEKPSSSATKSRSSGYVVPARAAEPNGSTSAASYAARTRTKSRVNIQ